MNVLEMSAMLNRKVILISIDGMRPDGLMACGNPFVQELLKLGSYTLDARTVFPSVTLPCHMSLFHSVVPQRHGITTNVYVPQVHPIPGLFEQIERFGGISAMYYGWEQLRDVSRPGSLVYASYVHSYSCEHSDTKLTELALERIRESSPDFVFLYMVETDEKGGHDSGWMTEEYLRRISCAVDNVKRVWEECRDEYTIVITADHGGHDHGHGDNIPEDMTIPQFYIGPDFEPGKVLENVNLLDTTPTIAKLMGLPQHDDWHGKALV